MKMSIYEKDPDVDRSGRIVSPTYTRSHSVYRGGSLLPESLREKIPGSMDVANDPDPKVRFRFFYPWGDRAMDVDVYVIAGDDDTRQVSLYSDDYILLVYCNGDIGSASLREIEAARFNFLRAERDRYFAPVPLSELRSSNNRDGARHGS